MPPPNARLRAIAVARTAARQQLPDKVAPPTQPQPTDLKVAATDNTKVRRTAASRDRSFWLALLLVVAPVYLVTPFSWGFVLYQLWNRSSENLSPSSLFTSIGPLKSFTLCFCLLECIFSIYYQIVAAKARRTKAFPIDRSPSELRLAFLRIIQSGLAPPITADAASRPQSPAEPILTLAYDDPRAVDFRERFCLWFRHAPWTTISRRSLVEWLCWSVFHQKLSDVGLGQRSVIEEATTHLEKRCGGRLREDDEMDDIIPVTLTMDPVEIWSRPGFIYALRIILNILAEQYLSWKYGMVKKTYNGLDYMIRLSPQESTDDTPQLSPLVFLHGLGFGLAQYLPTILLLLKLAPSNQPILVPLQPNISQAILHPFHLNPMPKSQWIETVRGLFHKLGWDRIGVTMISHSKGTVGHAWMLKAHPELIKRSCLMDPVCFCPWEGDVCWNFVYRTPVNAFQLLMKYFAGTEPGISLSVSRHFDWISNSIFFEDIPRARSFYHTSFFVGGKDEVLDGNRLRHYLQNHGVGVGLNWNPDGQHGQPVADPQSRAKLIAWLLASEPEVSEVSDSDSEDEIETSTLL